MAKIILKHVEGRQNGGTGGEAIAHQNFADTGIPRLVRFQLVRSPV